MGVGPSNGLPWCSESHDVARGDSSLFHKSRAPRAKRLGHHSPQLWGFHGYLELSTVELAAGQLGESSLNAREAFSADGACGAMRIDFCSSIRAFFASFNFW
jgi:hypothetical protein